MILGNRQDEVPPATTIQTEAWPAATTGSGSGKPSRIRLHDGQIKIELAQPWIAFESEVDINPGHACLLGLETAFGVGLTATRSPTRRSAGRARLSH